MFRQALQTYKTNLDKECVKRKLDKKQYRHYFFKTGIGYSYDEKMKVVDKLERDSNGENVKYTNSDIMIAQNGRLRKAIYGVDKREWPANFRDAVANYERREQERIHEVLIHAAGRY